MTMQPANNVNLQGGINRAEATCIGIILAAVFAIGLVIVPDFGQGTDEYSDFEYAPNSLRAYAGSRDFIGPSYEELHGPFHLEVAYLVGETTVRLPLGWTRTDGRHLANFGVFLLGVGGLYVLLRRELGRSASFLTTVLFASQPMLWGHAFINQKNSAFMSYFVLAVILGLEASDRLRPRAAMATDPKTHAQGRAVGIRRLIAMTGMGLMGALAVASLANLVFLPAARNVLAKAYQGTAWPPIQAVFGMFATDAYKTPLGLYVDKLELVYAWAKVPLTLLWLSLGAWTVRRRLPIMWGRAAALVPTGMPLLLASGVVLGLANSIRVAAPLAGVLVGGQMLIRHRSRAWIPLAVYGLTAVMTSYLTWPWLWLSPVDFYIQALRVMSAFPSHQVLFGGVVYSSSELPWDYIPRLLALETTEVVLPLFVIGLGCMAWSALRHRNAAVHLGMALLWLGMPIAIIVGLRSSVYGNLRQVLFVIPPIFLVAGHAIQGILDWLPRAIWRGAFAVVILTSGVIGIMSLHPYEDSYFNAWVGGVSGAYGQYMVDPWCTSYREAMQFLTTNATPNAVVDVRGPFQSAADFARQDLEMHPDFAAASHPDYVMICQLGLLGDGFHGDLPVIYEVRRGRAVLALVRGAP